MRSATLFAALMAACAWLAGASAAAAGLYTASGVRVDVTAPTAADARSTGYSAAETAAFDRVVRRVTLPDEIARLGMPRLAGAALDALVSNVQVEEERPLGARYIGKLSVTFDPAGVRRTLRGLGLTVVETRSAPLLVAPQSSDGADGAAWRAAWADGGFGDELAPIAIAPTMIAGPPSWTSVASAAAAAGATRAMFATVRQAGSLLVVDLVEVGADGARRERGAINAPFVGGYAAAARAVSDSVQNEWKLSVSAGASQRARLTASALYTTQTEWLRIKRGLEGAAKTMLSGVSIDAVSREGALVSFSYVGSREQLAAELLRNGLVLTDTAQGPALRAGGGG